MKATLLKKCFSIIRMGLLGSALFLANNNGFADAVTVSSGVRPPSITPGSQSTGCTYYATDTYANTENVSPIPSYPLTDGSNNLTLAWATGATSPLNTPVPCDGTYQIFFSLQVQSAGSATAVSIFPCVKTTDDVTVYGSCPAASSSMSFTHNPVCNGGNYCTVVSYPFTANVTLVEGQVISPPSIHTTDQIAITGGEFIVRYIGS
jgi:hypothetical protein